MKAATPIQEVKIANGAQLSDLIKFDTGALGITLPAAFDGTHLGVFGATHPTDTFRLLHDVDNLPVGVQNVRAGRTYVLFLAYPYPYIKLGFFTGTVSATVDATITAQTAERLFVDAVRA